MDIAHRRLADQRRRPGGADSIRLRLRVREREAPDLAPPEMRYGGPPLTALYLWRRNLWPNMLAHWIADGAGFLT